MKRVQLAVVVLTLALIVVTAAVATAQTQGLGGTSPVAAQAGTAPTKGEDLRAVTDGSVRQVEEEPTAAGSYNATLRIPAAALKPSSSDVEWQTFGGCAFASGGDPNLTWAAPLYLPDGATVRYFKMYYNDQSAKNCTAYLTLYDAWGHIVTEWALSSSGSSGEASATSPDLEVLID
jgi:hypothetical protein